VNTGAWRNHVRDDRPLFIRVIRVDFESHFQLNGTVTLPVLGDAKKQQRSANNRSQGKRDLARQALEALFPNGVPEKTDLSNGQLCTMVSKWIGKNAAKKSLQKREISDDTILRAAGRMN
jgi:hypothetical protein